MFRHAIDCAVGCAHVAHLRGHVYDYAATPAGHDARRRLRCHKHRAHVQIDEVIQCLRVYLEERLWAVRTRIVDQHIAAAERSKDPCRLIGPCNVTWSRMRLSSTRTNLGCYALQVVGRAPQQHDRLTECAEGKRAATADTPTRTCDDDDAAVAGAHESYSLRSIQRSLHEGIQRAIVLEAGRQRFWAVQRRVIGKLRLQGLVWFVSHEVGDLRTVYTR